MRFRKSVRAEAFDLLECMFGKVSIEAVCDHAVDELSFEFADSAHEFESGHRLAQQIGFTGCEAGTFDGYAHRLLLEERNPKGLAEHFFQLGLREEDGLQTFAATQIGMDHIALDRPWPHDRDLHHKIVEGSRFQTRQHRHLRTALDLESTKGRLPTPSDLGAGGALPVARDHGLFAVRMGI